MSNFSKVRGPYKYKSISCIHKKDNSTSDIDTVYDGYFALGNAIIIQALSDYETAARRIINKDYQRVSMGDWTEVNCFHFVEEVPKFMHSQWYDMLTTVDADMLMDYVKTKIERDSEVDLDNVLHLRRSVYQQMRT